MSENIFDDVSFLIADVLSEVRLSGVSADDVLGSASLKREEITELLFRNDCNAEANISCFVKNVDLRMIDLSHLSRKEIYALGDRCFCALDWIGSFRTSDLPLSLPANFSLKQLFCWLITDLWNHRKDLWIKIMACSVEDGFLYGDSYSIT